MQYIRFCIAALLLFFSCKEPAKPKDDFTKDKYIQTFGPSQKVNIGKTGLTIALPNTHVIEQQDGPDFTVYSIRSIDSAYNKGGAGIYFGTNPDQHPPTSEYQKEEANGVFLDRPCKTVKYTTPAYTWIETVADMGDGQKIQTWYYAYNEVELYNLAQMMNSISK